MPRGEVIVSGYFLRDFYTQLYINYSYLIQIIFKHIYFSDRYDTNRYYHSGSEWTWNYAPARGTVSVF